MSVIDRRDKVKHITEEQIGNNIKAERCRAGLTIEEVCEKLDISRPTYIGYEKNAELVRTQMLIKLAELFNCDIDMFFYTK
jgi:transcriptional regulator with XRE-family HTH domain